MEFCQNRILIPVFFCIVFLSNGYAQEKVPVNFGKVTAGDFTVNSVLVNESTNAVIIAEVGDVKFEGNNNGWFTYVFKVQRRIKIINRKAFNLADVKIYLYNDEKGEEKADKINAICYSLENGQVIESKLLPKDIYIQKNDKKHSVKKFAVPGIKEGCIIEYSYVVKSDFLFNLPSWDFQSLDAPTLWSEYNVVLPGLLSYMTTFQGFHTLFINKKSEGHESYSIRQKEGVVKSEVENLLSVSVATLKQRWAMKDVPAFTGEAYVFCAGNFIDKVTLQLHSTSDGEAWHDVANSWTKLEDELSKSEDFGQPLKGKKGWLQDVIDKIIKVDDSKIDAAKKIYTYVRQNYTCTERNNTFIKTTLKDVINKKGGTTGDINLLLIALLKQIDITAAPVLLSTRDFGYNSPLYPFMQKLNYVICRVSINDTAYYLDATQPFLSFGKLPLACYNGHARVIAPDTTAVYFWPSSLLESKLTNVNILNSGDHEITGICKQDHGFFESLALKNKIAASGLKRYLDEENNAYPEEMPVSTIIVDSFETDNGHVSVNYNFKIVSFKDENLVYFSPMFAAAEKTNPFFAVDRIYPVEMPYNKNDVYTFNMDIPNGYKVEALPKQTRVMLNEDEGMFEYLITENKSSIQMRCTLQIKKTFFPSEDYQTLRDFYAYIVKKEAEQIVFKKIK